VANGTDYVDWDTWKEHVDEAKHGFTRIEKLEAEVMGDKMTGRASLRDDTAKEIQRAITTSTRESKKTRLTIILSVSALLIGLIIRAVFEYQALVHAAVK
jgi:hypothetical protein